MDLVGKYKTTIIGASLAEHLPKCERHLWHQEVLEFLDIVLEI